MSGRTQDPTKLYNISTTGLSPSSVYLPRVIRLYCFLLHCGPTTPCCHGLGSFPFARRYLGNRFFFLFLQVLRCFSSLGLPPITLFIQVMVLGLLPNGFPHSDIPRSKLTYSSLRRFAVCCVLLRLLVPRHPPCALINLTLFLLIRA